MYADVSWSFKKRAFGKILTEISALNGVTSAWSVHSNLPPLNRTFLGWLTPSRMARNVLLFVQGREFQYQAQIFKCILSIETNIQGDATFQNWHGSNKCQLDTMQILSCTLSCVYHALAAWHSAGSLWLSSILPTQTLCQWMFGHLARRLQHFISNMIAW